MRRLLVASLSAVALVAFAPAARAEDTPKDIVKKAVKAHGGEEFLTKMLAAQSREKGKMTLPGVGEVEFTSETAYMLPDKFKNVLEFEVMNQKLRIDSLVNGGKVSVVTTIAGKEVDSSDGAKDAFKDVPHLLKVTQLAPLLDEKIYKLEHFGEEKVGGKPAVGVRVTAKGQKDITLFFDKETWLTVKVEYRTAEPVNGNEVTEERLMSGYAKNKDGISVPKKMVIKHDGKTFLEMELIEMTYLEKLPDAEFKK